jgi:hypothetical protein
MKRTFWSTYTAQFKQMFFENIVMSTIIVLIMAITPVSFAFLSWYHEDVPAKLVWKDPKAYPHKYKQRVEYRYYGTFYFAEINANKQVEIQETTHSNAKIGDVYLFSRSDKLQTGWRNTFMFAAIFNISITMVMLGALIFNFFGVANSYFSVKKKDTTFPYPDY